MQYYVDVENEDTVGDYETFELTAPNLEAAYEIANAEFPGFVVHHIWPVGLGKFEFIG